MSAEPRLDHVVVNARHGLDGAAQSYRQLGFSLTAPSRHTLGSVNRLAVFGQDYLELVGIDPQAKTPRAELLNTPTGLSGLVFATKDAGSLYRALADRGAPVEKPAEFSRPIQLGESIVEVAFRVVRVAADETPYGRVYFCEHLTPHYVWRAEWQHHANGAQAISRIVIAAAEPDRQAALYRRLFGDRVLVGVPGGLRLPLGPACLDILTHAQVAQEYGAAPEGDRMAALTIHTPSLDAVRAVLRANAVVPHSDADGRIVIAPEAAFGVAIAFES